ncbi:MAG: GNAT family N-acetyltransferase [Pseudomonadota bacterium]
MIENYATLRPYFPEDADAVARALEDKELLCWLAALPIPLEAVDREKYLTFLGDPEVCASVVCVDGVPVGSVSLGTELSFWIARGFHGQGLGLWAVRRFLDQVPETHETITACCMRDNLSAIAILDRLGFQSTQDPFRRFSFAHGHAVEFLRYHLRRSAGM